MEDQGCQRKCKENISVLLYLWQTDMTNKRRMFCDWFANIALTHWQYKLISIMTTTREQCKLAGQSYILKFTRRSNDFNDSLTGKKACWSCSGRSFYNWGVQQIVFKHEVGAAPWLLVRSARCTLVCMHSSSKMHCGTRHSEQFRIYLLICGWYLVKGFIFNVLKTENRSAKNEWTKME